jgi:hypothetical protein
MTIIDACKKYLNGDDDAINMIRGLSGIIIENQAILRLTLICAITRIEQGDLDKDTFWEVYLKQEKGTWKN